jgi:hypothetical protein
VRNDPEAGQSGGESASNPVRNGTIEGCNPPLPEADQEDWCDQDYQKRDDR